MYKRQIIEVATDKATAKNFSSLSMRVHMFGGPGKSNLASTRFHAFLICAVCSLLTDSAMMLDDDCESGVALYAIPEVENTVLLSPIFWPHTSVMAFEE